MEILQAELNPVLYRIAFFWVIAVITPGPNFFLVLNTGASSGRKPALAAVAGICAGTALWAVSGFLGINLLFTAAPWLYGLIKGAGAVYLILAGINLFRKKGGYIRQGNSRNSLNTVGHLRKGILINLSNPKTAVFISSMFATTIPADASPMLGTASVIIIVLISFFWYTAVCLLFSSGFIKIIYDKIRWLIGRLTGLIYVLFGLKILFSDSD